MLDAVVHPCHDSIDAVCHCSVAVCEASLVMRGETDLDLCVRLCTTVSSALARCSTANPATASPTYVVPVRMMVVLLCQQCHRRHEDPRVREGLESQCLFQRPSCGRCLPCRTWFTTRGLARRDGELPNVQMCYRLRHYSKAKHEVSNSRER